MELGTNSSVGVARKKDKVKISTVIIALLMIGISVFIALLVCMPDLWNQFMIVKWEVFKGVFIGISVLPVFLFVTIKGGKEWRKKWWVWVSIGITLVAIVAIVILKGNSMSAGDMGMSPMGDPYSNMGGGKVMMMP